MAALSLTRWPPAAVEGSQASGEPACSSALGGQLLPAWLFWSRAVPAAACLRVLPLHPRNLGTLQCVPPPAAVVGCMAAQQGAAASPHFGGVQLQVLLGAIEQDLDGWDGAAEEVVPAGQYGRGGCSLGGRRLANSAGMCSRQAAVAGTKANRSWPQSKSPALAKARQGLRFACKR